MKIPAASLLTKGETVFNDKRKNFNKVEQERLKAIVHYWILPIFIILRERSNKALEFYSFRISDY